MRKFFFSGLFVLVITFSKANNVTLSNITVTNNAPNTGKVIEFDLTWENSWRTASTGNWDGVWVFFKFKDNDGKWYPLRFTGTNITMPAGATFDMGNNAGIIGVGMFIYRSTLGSGTATANGIQAGIQSYPGTFDIRGFAIEMVYVPQDSFYLGDGNTGDYYRDSTNGTPYHVTGNGNTIQIGSGAGSLYDGRLSQPFNGFLSGFPAGYSDFWMMKYELSQGAYRDFLNTLTYEQQDAQFNEAIPPSSVIGTNITGNVFITIEIKVPGIPSATNSTPAIVGCDFDNDNVFDEATDGEWIACGHRYWPQAAAYLDWAGLRPMTELEYEKASRGPIAPVPDQYAWGTSSIANLYYILQNEGSANESISNSSSVSGNANYDGTGFTTKIGYVRGGIFATPVSTRVSSGAGYYGIMELSGSAWESCITTANVAGRSYGGKHGDGILAVNTGNANENNWPGVNGATGTGTAPGIYDGGNGVRSDGGLMNRGGYYNSSFGFLKTSNRDGTIYDGTSIIAYNSSGSRFFSIRGVRDAN